MAESKAFNQATPPKHVTDPLGLRTSSEFPKHLHKLGRSRDGGPLFVTVNGPEEEARAISKGWLLQKPSDPVATKAEAPVDPMDEVDQTEALELEAERQEEAARAVLLEEVKDVVREKVATAPQTLGKGRGRSRAKG